MEHRLKRRRDFDACFKKGKKAYRKELSMYYLEKPRGEVKIGISVGKKHGNAVTRNRVKRLLRAAYIPLIKKIVKPVNIVFVPKVADEYDYFNFLKSVEAMLKKENLIDENIE
ncbi:MAG TPA: ribonuclease P protein component [Clostridiales bacterium]|nr:ribonuclease P protein component [Clostridiales bacterium]